MGFYGSAYIVVRYMGARRDARDLGYPLLFSIGPKGSSPCTLPQTVTYSPGLFNTARCHCRESEKTAITNLASAGIEPTPIRATIEQRPSGFTHSVTLPPAPCNTFADFKFTHAAISKVSSSVPGVACSRLTNLMSQFIMSYI